MQTTEPRRKRSAYRADIDGLRAVAVLLVVFNHLRLGFRGGYVGVDVFFVISGYLIGAAILSEMGSGEFSLVNFYERRIRRIFPALFVMLLGASVLAYYYLLPSEMISFALSLRAAVFSVSNILFWHQAGYFDQASASKPLLHTWSLGVEEQFYIFFPLFLMAIRRWMPRGLKISLWTAGIVSFVVSVVCVHSGGATTAFFLAPWRAWELVLGAIASQGYLYKMKGPIARNSASAVGILLIVLPGWFYTAYTTFPGLRALAPCAGAVLVILAGETGASFVGSALSWRPVTFVGLISYSLYLWHWPLESFLNISLLLQDLPPTLGDKVGKAGVLLASFVVATLSWRFVETPFRTGRFRPDRRSLFIWSGVAAAMLVAMGLTMTETNGLRQRFSKEVLKADDSALYDARPDWRLGKCFLSDDNTFAQFDKTGCLTGEGSRKQYLLYGDSHAADRYIGLMKVFPDRSILQATVASCPPLLQEPEGSNEICRKMSAYIFGDFLVHHHVDAVILSARWFEPQIPELGRTIAWMKQRGIDVILMGPGVEFSEPLPRLVAIAIRDRRPDSFFEHYRLSYAYDVDREFAKLARTQWKVRYISLYDDLCASQVEMEAKAQPESAENCPAYVAPGVPLLRDVDHLSLEGSIMLARAIRERGELP